MLFTFHFIYLNNYRTFCFPLYTEVQASHNCRSILLFEDLPGTGLRASVHKHGDLYVRIRVKLMIREESRHLSHSAVRSLKSVENVVIDIYFCHLGVYV